jgi:hypothetical protein
MTNKSAARPQGGSEASPKIDPAPISNTEKELDDRAPGTLKTLSEECDICIQTLLRLKLHNGSTRSSRSGDRCNTGNPQ